MAVALKDVKHYEELYQVLLEAIPSSLLLVDRDLGIQMANRNFLEKSRHTQADTLGHRLPEVFPSLFLDNTDIARHIEKVFELNEPTVGDRIAYRAPGGLMRFYYYRIFPLTRHGGGKHVLLLMDDVTEQTRLSESVRQTERHLATVVESASEVIVSTDPDGTILSWNKSAEQITGWAHQEVCKSLLFKLCAPRCQAEVKHVFYELRKEKTTRSAEWDLLAKSGELIPISWICSPMLDDQSKTMGIVSVGRDLTVSRKLEAELQQARKLAALYVMAGGIAHEIRNPLAICSSSAQFLLEEGNNRVFQKECARKIQTGIGRASAIIENLLNFARLAPRSDLPRLNLIPILHDTLSLITSQTRKHHIELAVHEPPDPVLVRGDGSLLQQVFMNLFLNAINAMPKGGHLRLSVETDQRQVSVGVADTGCGISKSDVGNIFDPFFTKSSGGNGTGLGLAICYSIIQQHSGAIDVESNEGQGSTFTVRLPAIYETH